MGKAEKEKMKQRKKEIREKQQKAVQAKNRARDRKQQTSLYTLHALFIVLAELIVGIAVYFLTDFDNQNIYLAMMGVMLLIPLLYYRIRVIRSFGIQKNDVIGDAVITAIWGGALAVVYGNDFTVYALTAPVLVTTLVSVAAYMAQNKK